MITGICQQKKAVITLNQYQIELNHSQTTIITNKSRFNAELSDNTYHNHNNLNTDPIIRAMINSINDR